ncbi:hypothetical protein HN51_028376 [Arachis hypogaea]
MPCRRRCRRSQQPNVPIFRAAATSTRLPNDCAPSASCILFVCISHQINQTLYPNPTSHFLRYAFVALFNVTMWGCFVNSLKSLSSLQATVTNFATNFISSGLAGFFFFFHA